MERYTPGYASFARDFMMRRTIESHGSFFRPFLWPGARVLDCGCGPGTITAGIAAAVATEGRVCAVDSNAAQVEAARLALHDYPGSSCRVATAYELPFDAEFFDAIFSHALFEHLAEPGRAAGQMYRVLKPGGVIGIRSPDWTGTLIGPPHEQTDSAVRRYGELQAANGGDLGVGRKLGSILIEAGFINVRSRASFENYTPPSLISDYLSRQLEESGEGGLAGALRIWAELPGAFFAQAWCEVVGVKR